jgi:uncharacterized protein (TIGR03437 family)
LAAALARLGGLVALSATGWAGTFGLPVAIGGNASDLALDEARGVLYISNFTANRVEVMSLADNAVHTSMNVAPQPGSLALSPDGRCLVVTHYGAWTAPSTNKNAVTIINLSDNTRQTFALGNPPLGVAFGADGLALLVTTGEVLMLDPVSGATVVVVSAADLTSKILPAPEASFPPNILAASVAASGDGMTIYGLVDFGNEKGVIRYRYDVRQRRIGWFGFTSSPPMGPRVISPSADGTYFMAGWGLFDAANNLISQFKNVTGAFNVGGHVIDSAGNTIYAQLPQVNETEPILMVLDADNLNIRERLRLPENLAGKAVMNAARDTVYAVSDSGVMILPVGALNRQRRVVAQSEDLVFRGNFCDRRVLSQDLAIVDPGGGRTDFALAVNAPGVTITPASGVTPAVVKVQIDPNVYEKQNGTTAVEVTLSSVYGVNVPQPVRLLINNRNPDQRGTFVNVPGKLVDLLADPVRDRFYVLRQDRNEALVFDGATYTQIAKLRTYNTPIQMAVTHDRRYLLIGHDDSQMAAVYDLDTLERQPSIVFPFGHYPRSVASSGKAILGMSRKADGTGTIDVADMASRMATNLASLGVYENKLHVGTMLVASPNGSSIMAAAPNGTAMLYNANADTFVISRKDLGDLSGAYAASSYDSYVVSNIVLNGSLVPVRRMETASGSSAGFVFVDQTGFRTTTPGPAAPGVIQRVDPSSGLVIRPTRMVESPVMLAGDAEAEEEPATPIDPTGEGSGPEGVLARTLVALYNRSAVVSLTTSGFTMIPWNYDSAVAPPRITRVVNAADGTLPVAPGGLISVFGTQFSPVNVATKEVPLPTALGESCLTVNGLAIPMLFVSPGQIHAQLPFTVDGSAQMVLRTPGGVSDNFNFTVLPTAPSIFRSGIAGPETGLATVVRRTNGEFVTPTNPVHPGDQLLIFATGLGCTDPAMEAGVPAPSDPAPRAIVETTVTLGGVPLGVGYAGLEPGEIGVYRIEVAVPARVPLGMDIPLVITQGGGTTALAVRVVD